MCSLVCMLEAVVQGSARVKRPEHDWELKAKAITEVNNGVLVKIV